MKNLFNLKGLKTLVIASAVAGSMSARATIDMTLIGTGLSASDVGLTGPGGTITPGTAEIGLYQFQVIGADISGPGLATGGGFEISGLGAGETFESVCLSPSGNLDWNMHSYDYETFSAAASGINPGDWAPPAATGGIQDAAYLWRLFNSSVTTGSQGAGLAEAMYKVLYDSTGYGTLSGSPTFTPNFGSDSAALAAYTYYINYFLAHGGSAGSDGIAANLLNGYLLVPNPNDSSIGAGQEFIILDPNVPNLVPVPETTTIVSAALLLLPFGACTLRVIRKKSIIS